MQYLRQDQELYLATINLLPETSGARTVGEDMAEVGFTGLTQHLEG